MSTSVYPHERDDCDSCRAFDADLAVDVLDADNVLDQSSRWCERCAGPLLTKLVLKGRTAVVSSLDAPLARESAAAEVRRRRSAGKPASAWTVDLAEDVLRSAQPSASKLIRALVDEGGAATAARLKELTGEAKLHHMTQSLNTSARRLWSGPLPDDQQRLFVARPRNDPDHPREQKVHSYDLPAELVEVWDEALRRLGR